MKNTLNQLIEDLLKLKAEIDNDGYTEVIMMQYNGGDDAPFFVKAVQDQDFPDRIVIKPNGYVK